MVQVDIQLHFQMDATTSVSEARWVPVRFLQVALSQTHIAQTSMTTGQRPEEMGY